MRAAIQCEVCSASFTNTHYDLQRGETTNKCEVCYAIFFDWEVWKDMLELPVGSSHTSVKYVMLHSRAGALKRHARINSVEKPYKCQVCYAAFFEWELWKDML